jgi:hypothetical protein
MRKTWWAPALILLAGCGPFCGPTAFYVSSASADAIYTCAQGAAQQPYDLHVTIAADNPTSSDVTITSASADMVVATVHGTWKQPVGFKYSAGNVPFSPTRVPKGSKTNVTLTIPSACTNNSKTGTEDNYADYTVRATIVTSAGTYTVTCSNKHRILAK